MSLKEFEITIQKIIPIIKKSKLSNPEIVGMLEILKTDFMFNHSKKPTIRLDGCFGKSYSKGEE